MLKNILKYLHAPVYPDDEAKTYKVRLLHRLVLSLLILTVVYTVLLTFSPETDPSLWPMAALSLGAYSLCLYLIHSNRMRIAANILFFLLWLIETGVVLLFGSQTIAPSVYIVLIIAAALVMDGKYGLTLAAFCAVTMIGISYFESQGMLTPTGENSRGAALQTAIFLYGSTGLLLLSATNIINDSLKRARHYAKQLEERQKLLEESEARYRRVSELTSDFAYSVLVKEDGFLETEWVTDAIETITGYAVEELTGSNSWMNLIHPEDSLSGEQQVEAILYGHPLQSQLRIITKNNEIRWLYHSSVPEWDENNERVVRIMGAAQDITKQKLAEAQISASLREKEVLLKEIHHRVKNNLQVVCSLLDLQASHLKEGSVIQMFHDSRSRVRSMAFVHERLYQSPDLARIDLGEYIKEFTRYLIYSHGLEAKEILLEMDLASVWVSIEMAIPLGLIVNELILNSLKHAFPNGRSGRIYLILTQTGSEKYQLVIQDEGVGFPEGVDFRRSASLGLNIVTTLVDQIRGRIELHRGSGTRFELDFTVPNKMALAV